MKEQNNRKGRVRCAEEINSIVRELKKYLMYLFRFLKFFSFDKKVVSNNTLVLNEK